MYHIIKKLTYELENMVINGTDYHDIVSKSQELDKYIVLEMERINKHLINKKER